MAKSIDEVPTVAPGDDESFWRDAPSILARMAVAHGPIFKRDFPEPLPSGMTRLVYLVGPEANRLVLHTHREHFSHADGWTPVLGPFFGKGLLNMDGQEWARHRKMMNPAFTQAYMATYLPVMHRVIQERTADWLDRGEVDLYDEAREIAFDVAASALVGFQRGDQVDRLRDLFYTLLHPDYDPERETRAQFQERMQGVEQRLRDLLLPFIAGRRRAPPAGTPSDVMGMMLLARDDDGQALSDAQLLAHTTILLVAGHETTTTLASWLLHLLALHPAYLARVHQELGAVAGDSRAPVTLEHLRAMPLLGNAVAEAGRLQSPVRFGPRGVVKDVDFAGYTIPAGTHIRYAIAAGHRLPTIFANPDTFDPDRFAPPREEDKRHPWALVTFGGGPRICIGVNMAQVEVKALAAHVLRRYTLEPAPDQEVVQAGMITGFPEHGIRARVVPRRKV